MFLTHTQIVRISMIVSIVMGLYVLPWTKDWFSFLNQSIGGQVTIASLGGIWLLYTAYILYQWRRP